MGNTYWIFRKVPIEQKEYLGHYAFNMIQMELGVAGLLHPIGVVCLLESNKRKSVMFDNIKADIGRYYSYGYMRPIPFLLFEEHQVWAIICYRYGNHVSRLHLPGILGFFPKGCWFLGDFSN